MFDTNSLRYVAGYVCRKASKQLETSKHEEKDYMISCMMELSGDEENEERGTENWTNLVDRGGLWHVNDIAYYLFYAIEEEVHYHLVPDLASKLSEGSKDIITSAVMDSEDVLFQWSLFGPRATAVDRKAVYNN